MIKIMKGSGSSEIEKDGFALDIDGIRSWLIYRGIKKETDFEDEILVEYKDLKKWHRSGGETYLTSFSFCTSIQQQLTKYNIVLKAIVTVPIEETLNEWKFKRNLLKNNKVQVSNWYYCGDGIIIEDFYAYSVREYSESNNPNNNKFLDDLINIACKIGKLGFNALDIVRDLRVNKNGQIFLIDFGFDLGNPTFKVTTKPIESVIKSFPSQKSYIKQYVKSKFPLYSIKQL